MPKIVFVTGGVLSSLGKGIIAASIAKLLRAQGVNANAMKIDPYLNCDAGTLNPFEHGECFVTIDGFECDLDVGNYERFLGITAVKEQNLMMGSAYKAVIEKERKGEFLGKTIQLIPHLTDEIKRRIEHAVQKTGADVLVVEIGGTVGDYESEMVLEAARQIKYSSDKHDALFVHLALVPTIITGEQKTKPLQHSVKALLARGIMPDVIIGRSDKPLPKAIREKIALFCNVSPEQVFFSPNVSTVYEVPLVLRDQGLAQAIADKLDLKLKDKDLEEWEALVKKFKRLSEGDKRVKIGVVGKYAVAKDMYMSVFESLGHAGVHNDVFVDAELVDSEGLESGKVPLDALKQYDGLVVPGGFGGRGVEGKISAVKYARENKIPYLGLCYGMQLAVIEYARNVLGLKDANSTEIDESTNYPVIDILPEQKDVKEKGGTMRLGGQKEKVKKGTIAWELYGKKDEIEKRHRHRFEVNPEYIERLEKAGMVFSAVSEDGVKMEIMELPKETHPYFMGTQAHPEFDSRLEKPEPLFEAFIAAAKARK